MASKKSKAKKAVKAIKKYPVIIAVAAVVLAIVIIVTAVLWFTKPGLFHTLIGTGEHSWEYSVLKEATCEEDGSAERTCNVCGESEPLVIPAKGHIWGGYITDVAATCVDAGSQYKKCSVCGETVEEVIPANGHVWGERTVKKQATCGDGVYEHTCTVCDETEEDEETIPGTGEHSWGEFTVTVPATCGDGREERECSGCHDKQTRSIAGTGEHNFADGVCTVCGYADISSEVSIHFIELGNKYTGDCTLIKCGDTEVLIDAGSRKDSALAIKEYVDKYCTDGVLEYVIATHAHQDHIAGFVGSSTKDGRTGILYQYEIGTIIQFAGHNTTSQIYKDYCTAVEYAKSRGTQVFTANECWYESAEGAQKQYFLDDSRTVSMNVLYNYYYDHETKDENDYSVCMLLTQSTGGNTYNYLFTGDLEEKGESYLVDNNALPEVNLFKGGHHGSYTASTDKLLNVIKPENVAVCCCCGTTEYTTNALNTFPSQAFIDRVSKHTENIYCTTLVLDYKNNEFTSMNGNIVFYTSGGKLNLQCSDNDTVLKDTDWFKENRTWNP